MFTGATPEEEKNEAERIRQGLDLVADTAREAASPLPKDNAERWRKAAFDGAEHLSKFFDLEQPGEHYRISVKNGLAYLERISSNTFTGVFLPEGDLPKLARVFVDAAKDYMKRTER